LLTFYLEVQNIFSGFWFTFHIFRRMDWSKICKGRHLLCQYENKRLVSSWFYPSRLQEIHFPVLMTIKSCIFGLICAFFNQSFYGRSLTEW